MIIPSPKTARIIDNLVRAFQHCIDMQRRVDQFH